MNHAVVSDEGYLYLIDSDTSVIVFDDTIVSKPGYDNFVGFGDSTDVCKIELETKAKVSFSVIAQDETEFSIYALERKNGTGRRVHKLP